MAKIQRKVREFLAIAAALATGGCSLETTSERREFGDSAQEQCVPLGPEACGEYNCGVVPDGCGGEVRCGPDYWRGTDDDFPTSTHFCWSDYPFFWTCARNPGGPAPRSTCQQSPSSPADWCCQEGS